MKKNKLCFCNYLMISVIMMISVTVAAQDKLPVSSPEGPLLSTLLSGTAITTNEDPDSFLFNNIYPAWCAVGVRELTEGTNWDIYMYNSTFTPPTLAQSENGSSRVDFVVTDNHHAPMYTRGIKVDRIDGTGDARLEYEGSAESLVLGKNGSILWQPGDVMRMWDIELQPGTYHFRLTYNSGAADLGFALFKSDGTAHFAGRNPAVGISDHDGGGFQESFDYTVTASEVYGLCVWSNDGNPADFNITISIAEVWLGLISADWSTPGNWSAGIVPNDTVDVTIPSGTPFAPIISTSATHSCRNLALGSGAILTQTHGQLHVYGNFYSDLGTFIQTMPAILRFRGNTDTYWKDNNEDDSYWTVQVQKENPEDILTMYDNMTVNSTFYVNGGNFMIDGINTISILESGPSFWVSQNAKLTLTDGTMDVTGSIHFYTYSNALISGGNIICGGNLYVHSNSNVQITGGTVIFDGNGDQNFEDSDGDTWLYNLTIDKPAGTVYITGASSLVIKNDFTLNSGTFDAPDNMFIAGDWINQAGPAAFLESGGTVTFNNSTASQNCWGEVFHRLEIDKAEGYLFVPTGCTVTCYEYDWTEGGIGVIGTFTALDLADNGLFGTYYMPAGGQIDLYQDATQTVDLAGKIIILSEGIMNVHGGDNYSYWGTYDDTFIHMNGGRLDFKDVGLWIMHSPPNVFIDQILGGTISMKQYFICFRNDFDPSGGTLEFNCHSVGNELVLLTGSNLHHLLINSTSPLNHVNFNTAYDSHPGIINGGLTINGGVFAVWSNLIQVTGDVNINYGGALELWAGSSLKMHNADSLKVNAGGRLLVDPGGTIEGTTSADYYHFDVFSGGSIAAVAAGFQNMTAAGIHIHPGGLIDADLSLHNCTFSNGAPGGTLLTLNNSQDLIIDDINFPANTWGGASNVTKNEDAGNIYFREYTGAFSGEDFDNDTYNRIDWVEPLVVIAFINPDTICDGSSYAQGFITYGGVPPYYSIWDDDYIYPGIPLFTTTFYLTVTDALGTTATSSAQLTINPSPIVSCPDDFEICMNEGTVYLETLSVSPPSNSSSSVFSGPGVTVVDAGMGWYDFNPVMAGAGTHTITYTYTNEWGCADSCSFDITVNPVPELSCPVNVPVCADTTAFILTYCSPPGGFYSGMGVIYGNTFDPAFTGPGNYMIMYTYISGNGCANSCSFTITVYPVPDVSCPPNLDICLNNGIVYLDWLAVSPPSVNSSSVFSGPGVIPFNPSLGEYDFNPVIAGTGTHTITYTYVDVNGCNNACTFTITVHEVPVVSCPDDFELCLNSGILNLDDLDVSPPSIDAFSVFSGPGVSGVLPEFGEYNFDPLAAGPGSHTITYTYTDINLCSNTCTFIITVNDLPLVSCPDDFDLCLNNGLLYLEDLDVFPPSIDANSVFSGPGVGSFLPELGEYDFDPVEAGTGNHLITYTYTDSNGCSNACTFVITVNDLVEVTCPQTMNVCVDEPAFALTGGTPAGGTYSGLGVSGNMFDPAAAGPGLCDITYSYSDTNGCVSDCYFIILVHAPPEVSCPPGYSLCLNNGIVSLEGAGVTPVPTDAGSVFTGPGVIPFNPALGQYDFDPMAAGPGIHTITYTYTDSIGCYNACTFTITVNDLPLVSCPDDFDLCLNNGLLFLEDLDVFPPSIDANSVFSGPGVGSFLPELGEYDFDPVEAGTGNHLITYTYTDSNGCSNACTFVITVNDLVEVTCPQTMNVCVDEPAFALTGGTPAGGTYSGLGVSGNMFDPAAAGPGLCDITYSYSDTNGCVSDCYFIILVHAPPEVSCPPGYSLCLNNGIVSLEGAGVTPVPTDAGSVFTGPGVIPFNPALGQYDFDPMAAGPGIHTITYTYTDSIGCYNACTFTITVNDLPLVSCPDDFDLCLNNGLLFLEDLDVFPPSIDANSVFSGPGVNAFNPGLGEYDFDPELAGIGDHVITYAFTDANGCSNTCTFVISVNDMPVVNCPADMSSCFDAPAFALTGGTPAGGLYSGAGVTGNSFDPAAAGPGLHTITYIYTDINGCNNQCNFSILVFALPVVNCPADISVCIDVPAFELTGGTPSGGTYSGPGVSSNSFDPSAAGPGIHSINYAYSEITGCTNACTFTITVNDLPLVSCPDDFDLCLNNGLLFLEDLDVFPPSIDANSVFSGPGVGSFLPELGEYDFDPVAAGTGSHLITYTYTDSNGCSNACTFTITVHTVPVADAGPDAAITAGNSTVLNGSGLAGSPPYTFSWSPAASLSDPDIPNPVASPLETTTYTLTISDLNACYDTDEVTVMVFPSGTGFLNGTVTYANAASSSLSEVSVRLEQAGVTLFTTNTGIGGYYEFSGIPAGNYQLRCTSVTPWGGVNAIDAQLVMHQFVHMISLTGMSLIAANVDLIPVINTIDALMISKRFTEVISSFPLGDWYFEPFDVNIEGGISQTQDIKGICLGDVNNSYLPPYKTPPRALLVEKGELQVSAGAVTEIPVCCSQDLAVGSISLVVEYPVNDMKIMGVSCDYDDEYLVFNEIDGTLRIAWFSPQARFFTAGAPIIRLSAIMNKAEGFKLRALAESELSDQDGICIQDCELSYPKIRLSDESFASSVELRPNPFNETAALLIRTTCPSDLNIKFFTADGQLVSAMKRQLPGTGLHQIELDGCQMSAGSYYCLVEMQEKDMIRTHRIKVIIIR
ncbi:MAG TPA: hypothetical protein P5112_03735 [Bacteroidales bacterium]|nr:hypothetical protein [Bacteroidales bacterium]